MNKRRAHFLIVCFDVTSKQIQLKLANWLAFVQAGVDNPSGLTFNRNSNSGASFLEEKLILILTVVFDPFLQIIQITKALVKSKSPFLSCF